MIKYKFITNWFVILFITAISVTIIKAQSSCPIFIPKPATFVSANKAATVGNMSYVLDGEGTTGLPSDGTNNYGVYWMQSQNPVTFYFNMNSPSTISRVKFYDAWGFDEGPKNVTIRLYNSSTLLGTENIIVPYLSTRYVAVLSKTYSNVTKIQMVIVDDYDTNFANRTSLTEVVFGDTVCADTDGDTVADYLDLDNDNDGIKDINENCSGFLAQNSTGIWKGKTASNLTATLTGAIAQANTHSFSDGQIRYYVNQNGGDPRYYKAGAASFTYSFSSPVPANEIAFFVDDVDPSNGSTNITVSFKINGGDPNGNFIAIDYGENPLTYLNYNTITGVMSSSSSGLDDQRLILKGIGNTLVSSITVTNSGIASSDGVAYALLANHPCDIDGDGIANIYDLDSDGDGCVDAIEGAGSFTSSQLTTASSTLSSQSPNENFGIAVDANGIPTTVGTTGQGIGESQDHTKNDCIDTDGDGVPNWQDLDNDNDGILDKIENCIDNTILTLDRNNISGVSTFSILGGNNDVTPITSGYTYWVGSSGQDESIQYTFTNPAYSIQIPQVINISGTSATNSELLEVYINGTLYPITASMVSGLNSNSFITSGGTIGSTTNSSVTNFNSINIYYPAGIQSIRIRNNPNASTPSMNGWEMNGLKILSRSTCNADIDGDGILNSLDLDSDNDGCSDAIEGGANFTTSDLVNSAMPGGNSGATSGTYNQPVIQNLGNTVGNTATTMGVPTIAVTGQAIGDSQNSTINSCLSAFICNDNIYLSISTSTSDPTTLYSVNYNVTPYTMTAVGDNSHGVVYNAIGYNKVDNYIYAISRLGNTLYQIGSNGNLQSLGIVTGLPSDSYVSGDVLSDGNTYIVRANGTNRALYSINIMTRTATLLTTLADNIADIAYNPIDNLLYTATNTTNKLLSINPSTGVITEIGNTNVALAFGAMFGTSSGKIFGVSNAGDVYVFNLATGNASYIQSISGYINQLDGTACISDFPTFCYKPAQTTGTTLDTNHGITALGRAGADNSNWPMVRKGAWTILEAKTKGFVVNRLTDAQISAIPAAQLVEGMMVYNITQDCLQINVDGTATGWKCFNTQACPD